METAVQTCYRHPDQPAGVICQRCDRPICPRCMHQASVGFHCPECTKAGKQQVYQGVSSLRVRPIVTQILIAVNVGVFMLAVAIEGAGAFGGEIGRLHIDFGLFARGTTQLGGPVRGVGAGEWYRMITSGFLHYGIIHLALNMYMLWILGSIVEQMAGRLRYGIIYGVGLVAGSLGALVVSPGAITAGASGAIFGLMGAIFLAHRAQGIPFRNSPLLGVLLLNLVFTFGVGGISIGGHLGGLIGGGLAGWLLLDVGARPGMDRRIPLAACGVVVVACIVAGVLFASSWTPT